MRFTTLTAGMVGMAMVVHGTACADTQAPGDARPAVLATNGFAFDLYRHLQQEEGNLFFSPYSITSALAMTWAGARGETADELARLLHFDAPADAIHAAFQELNGEVNAPSEEAVLRVANALWGQEGYPFHEAYLELVRDHYGGALESLDFIGDSEAARERINAWVEEQTEERIQDLIPPGVLDALTRLVLTNAIYFKGDWERPFHEDNTHDSPFHLLNGEEIEVPRMHQTGHFSYAENDDLQAIRLPYEGGDMSMLVLLPRALDGLPALEEKLSADFVESLLDDMQSREVNLGLPRFETTREFALGDTLQAIGARQAFSPHDADFTGMTEARELYITEVVHKAFVEVNETGTEAAAATGVIIGVTSAPLDPPAQFMVDRPFVFALRHEVSGALLFLGRVQNPNE